MTVYSVLVHNQKTMDVIATLCIEAENATEATRMAVQVVRMHQSFGTLTEHAQVMPALDASQIKHLDWLDACTPLDPIHVRGAGKPRASRHDADKPRLHWWPRLQRWWATRHQQFEPVAQTRARNWVKKQR